MDLVSDDRTETPEQTKARLLRCPKLKASVCKVARAQGIARDQEEDVYQETMLRMAMATLPPTDAEARKYVHGIVRHAAIDHLRKLAEETDADSLDSLKEQELAVRQRLEQRVQIQGLFRQGFEKFGAKWDLWMRNKIHKETSEEIASTEGLAPSHVRHEVSLMNRWFDGAWGKRTGSIGGVLALLLVVGAGWWMTHRPVGDADLTGSRAARTDTRVVGMDAAALRERGTKACDAGAWSACEEDLAAAAALDSAGETVERVGLEAKAISKQMRHDADGGGSDGQQMNTKPGR